MAESESGDNNKIVKVEHEDETEESDEDEYIVQNVVPHDNQVSGLHGDKSIQYGDVTIQNSSEVYLGNIYTAPITVVNHVNPVSPTTVPERLEFQGGSVERFTEGSFLKGDQALLKKRKKSIKIAIGIGCAIILIIIATFLGIYFRNQAYDDISEELLHNQSWFVSREEWHAQDPKDVTPIMHPIPLVIICHTAMETCSNKESCVDEVRYMQNLHIRERDFFDIAYNFLVGGDGRIYEGATWDRVGAHTYRYNSRSVGIAFIGNYDVIEPSELQLNATRSLIRLAVERGKIAVEYKLYGHRQLIIANSPGQKLYNIIRTWPHWASEPRSGGV